MLELKPISSEAIASALEKAERYRLLNEPREAESICRDVILVEPGNQEGIVTLLLALTDQFADGLGVHLDDARLLLPKIEGEYECASAARGGGVHIRNESVARDLKAVITNVTTTRRARWPVTLMRSGIMLELKPISSEAIASALEKAERYRLLNEPREAESICRDVILVEPGNQEGIVTLLLALTDQFADGLGVHLDDARLLLPKIEGEYECAYYEGVILERWAKAQSARESSDNVSCDWLRMAMSCYDKAETIRPPGNDEAILRWNACARMIERSEPNVTDRPRPMQPQSSDDFDDEVPVL